MNHVMAKGGWMKNLGSLETSTYSSALYDILSYIGNFNGIHITSWSIKLYGYTVFGSRNQQDSFCNVWILTLYEYIDVEDFS